MQYSNIKLHGLDATGAEKDYKLSDFKGKEVILYFYPKDDTSGCTMEAGDFRDNLSKLDSKATIVGVSPDDIKSHKKFREKHGLNFILLSDPEHKLADAFKVWDEKTMHGKKHEGITRSTFVLDKENKVKKEWRNVDAKGHVDKVLAEFR